MNRALWSKCFREARWAMLANAVVVFGFCWVRVWTVSWVDTESVKGILNLLPVDWKKLASVDIDWLITYAGRIAWSFQEPIVVFSMSIWAIGRGSDCVSGELNRGTMEMLLAQPLSRRQVLGHQAAVTILGVVLIAAAAWLGDCAGIRTVYVKERVRPTLQLPFLPSEWKLPLPTANAKPEMRLVPMSEKASAVHYLPAAANYCAFGIFWAGIASLVSACDRYRWRAIGLVVGGYIVQMILALVGMAVEQWHWLSKLSIFRFYAPEVSVHLAVTSPGQLWSFWRYDAAGHVLGLGPLGNDLTLVLGGLLAYIAAAIVFERRDLPAPL